jgi:hypothetical protein
VGKKNKVLNFIWSDIGRDNERLHSLSALEEYAECYSREKGKSCHMYAVQYYPNTLSAANFGHSLDIYRCSKYINIDGMAKKL